MISHTISHTGPPIPANQASLLRFQFAMFQYWYLQVGRITPERAHCMEDMEPAGLCRTMVFTHRFTHDAVFALRV